MSPKNNPQHQGNPEKEPMVSSQQVRKRKTTPFTFEQIKRSVLSLHKNKTVPCIYHTWLHLTLKHPFLNHEPLEMISHKHQDFKDPQMVKLRPNVGGYNSLTCGSLWWYTWWATTESCVALSATHSNDHRATSTRHSGGSSAGRFVVVHGPMKDRLLIGCC